MLDLHPTTSKSGRVPNTSITKGKHRDAGKYPEKDFVYCKQCGFIANLSRDARGLSAFSGHKVEDKNVISNGSLENWTAGTPDNWTLSGTVTQEQSAGYYDKRDNGSSSAKIVRNGSTIELSQVISSPSNFNGEEISFVVRVKSLTNGVIRIRIDVNGTFYSSHYNISNQNWRDISLLVSAPSSVTSLTVYISADQSDGTAYVDAVYMTRSGNPTTVSNQAGCPSCASFNYY